MNLVVQPKNRIRYINNYEALEHLPLYCPKLQFPAELVLTPDGCIWIYWEVKDAFRNDRICQYFAGKKPILRHLSRPLLAFLCRVGKVARTTASNLMKMSELFVVLNPATTSPLLAGRLLRNRRTLRSRSPKKF